MQELEDLKAAAAKLAADITTIMTAKDAEIKTLTDEVAALKTIETVTPADLQAVTDSLNAVDAALAPAAPVAEGPVTEAAAAG